MADKYAPISGKLPRMFHGGDYNPDQWLCYPDVLEEDIRLMKLSKCNVMSIGIFAWAALEPEEGVFTFDWLDAVLERFASNGIYAFLATPSGARPAWMSQKYPEVLRVGSNRVRNLHGFRHNHCYTSPVYREKTAILNAKLAERYARHPAVIGWHISNEFGGECHCGLCQEAFRTWLKEKYGTLGRLNHAWWSSFWSHTFTDWSQIESPAPHGEPYLHGLNLDWKRFVTDQTVDFFRSETVPLRQANPELPVTTNLMGTLEVSLNYWKFADAVDFVSWDSYPTWHDAESDAAQAARVGFLHDINRTFKGGRPFVLMESTPSMTNWQPVSKLKRPGMHLLSSLQAVAHGSDSVMYFQWRKSRGSFEKFHGAVVDHAGHEHSRVFRDVTDVGMALEKLDGVVGTTVRPEVALIFDWENRWALQDAMGPRNQDKKYEETVLQYYRAFWQQGVPVDVIDMDGDFSAYKLVVAPMLYMLRPGVAERLERFVEQGGTLVATYWTGIVDEHDLCFLGGFPGPLRRTLGIWSEEIDALYDADSNEVEAEADNGLGLTGTYKAKDLCDLIHAEAAEVLARYGSDFYAGRPALTVNRLGQGEAYYVASRNEDRFHRDFLGALAGRLGIERTLAAELPDGVSAAYRTDGVTDYVFVMNFEKKPQNVRLDEGDYTDVLTGIAAKTQLVLEPYGVRILQRPARRR